MLEGTYVRFVHDGGVHVVVMLIELLIGYITPNSRSCGSTGVGLG
jgi:hypothetical protein